jgi:hypothetical protein
MYALDQVKNNSQVMITYRTKLDHKEIPLVKWNAKISHYDVLHKSGYCKIDEKTIIQNFIVYSIPRNGNRNGINYDDIVKLFISEFNIKHK